MRFQRACSSRRHDDGVRRRRDSAPVAWLEHSEPEQRPAVAQPKNWQVELMTPQEGGPLVGDLRKAIGSQLDPRTVEVEDGRVLKCQNAADRCRPAGGRGRKRGGLVHQVPPLRRSFAHSWDIERRSAQMLSAVV